MAARARWRSASPAAKLSLDDEDGLVQGSGQRWETDGGAACGVEDVSTHRRRRRVPDVIHLRTSRDDGATFGAHHRWPRSSPTSAAVAPGFNRGNGLGFPVDRDRRRNSARAWTRGRGMGGITRFLRRPGRNGGGCRRSGAERSTWSTRRRSRSGRAIARPHRFARGCGLVPVRGASVGQTRAPDPRLARHSPQRSRSWPSCSDGVTALALQPELLQRARAHLAVSPCPRPVDYFVTVAPATDLIRSVSAVDHWRRAAPMRGRDQRDVFAGAFDDGSRGASPVRAGDSPTGYDDWLPGLAVAGDGKPYMAWYDWRHGDPEGCGAASTLYLTRSDRRWRLLDIARPGGRSVPSVWSSV